ncbi:MAG TPA: HAD family hydrolase [Acidimicrobiia bacterium]|nr:HAD family hydrolase [Acidimicrobiia bacterium]
MPNAGVLVDVDGTLVDSNYHHTLAWSRALRDHDQHARLAAIHRLVGMGSSELLTELGIRGDHDAITCSWRTHFDRLLPEVVAFAGAAELLRGMQALGLTVVLATSSPEDLLDALRAKIDGDDAVDVVVAADDVEQAKPHPDIFETALEQSGLDRECAIVVGDSVWDVEAASRASLPCIGVETGGFSRLELEQAGAVQVCVEPLDLLAHLDTSRISALAASARCR